MNLEQYHDEVERAQRRALRTLTAQEAWRRDIEMIRDGNLSILRVFKGKVPARLLRLLQQ